MSKIFTIGNHKRCTKTLELQAEKYGLKQAQDTFDVDGPKLIAAATAINNANYQTALNLLSDVYDDLRTRADM